MLIIYNKHEIKINTSKIINILLIYFFNSKSICDSQENDRHQRSFLYKVSKATGRLRQGIPEGTFRINFYFLITYRQFVI